MQFKTFALGVVAVAVLAPVALAQEAAPYVRPYWWDKPVVEGLGRALIEVAPNRARFDVAFVETDAKSEDAMKKAVQRSKIAYDAIRKVAGDKARVTTSVNVTAFYKQYKDKDGLVQSNNRADQVDGYEARVSMTVDLIDPSLAGRARAAALILGPQSVNPVYIYLQQTPEMQRHALDEAAKDARLRAQITASAAGARLGDILVVHEGSESCLGNWSTTQVARVIDPDNAYRYGAPMAPPPPAPPPPRLRHGWQQDDCGVGKGSGGAGPAERCRAANDAVERLRNLYTREVGSLPVLAARNAYLFGLPHGRLRHRGEHLQPVLQVRASGGCLPGTESYSLPRGAWGH